jgi:hypothetical protein
VRIEGRKRFGLVAGTVAAVLIGGGVAVAYWTSGGTGTGSATAGSVVGVTVSQDTPLPANLYPDGPAQDINFSINNPNTTPATVRISTVTIAITAVTPGPPGPTPACTAADFQLTQPGPLDADVPNGSTPFTGTGAAIQMIDNGLNQDRCKGATVSLSFTAA